MKLKTVAVYHLRMCTKADNSDPCVKGDNKYYMKGGWGILL